MTAARLKPISIRAIAWLYEPVMTGDPPAIRVKIGEGVMRKVSAGPYKIPGAYRNGVGYNRETTVRMLMKAAIAIETGTRTAAIGLTCLS